MYSRHPDAPALRSPYDQWYCRLAAQHEAKLGRLVHQHIHGKRNEVEDLNLYDRSHAGDCGTHAAADESCFGDWCVAHALPAEFIHKPF